MIDLRFRKKVRDFELSATLSDSGSIEFTGQNGSGKTTLLKCIAGYLQIDDGHIIIDGADITNLEIIKRRTVYISHDSYLPSLTVKEHLRWPLGKMSDGSQIERLRELLGINYDGKLKNLSLGQKLRVSIATAIISMPVVLLLDEVLQNISDRGIFMNELGHVCHEAGITVLSASQESSDRALFQHSYSLNNGSLEKVR